MAERPYVSFAEVKQKVPIPEVLEIFGVAHQFQQVGKTLTGVCPLPTHRHGPHPNPEQFKINCRNGVWLWHCFGDCQKGGDVIELVRELTGFSHSHVRFWFVEKFGERLSVSQQKLGPRTPEPSVEETARNEKARELPCKEYAHRADSEESSFILPTSAPPLKPLRFHLNLDPAVPYLRQRGLTEETIRKFGLGLCQKGVLQGYVAIPVYSHPHEASANPIGYLGRWPGEDFSEEKDRPRYKFPSEFPRNRVVYGLSEALRSPADRPLIIVEGPFKLYHLAQSGFANTVATFGASLSDEQAEMLVATRRQLVLLFDGDEAGRKGARLAAGKLISRSFVRAVKLADGVEPDVLKTDELHSLLK